MRMMIWNYLREGDRIQQYNTCNFVWALPLQSQTFLCKKQTQEREQWEQPKHFEMQKDFLFREIEKNTERKIELCRHVRMFILHHENNLDEIIHSRKETRKVSPPPRSCCVHTASGEMLTLK